MPEEAFCLVDELECNALNGRIFVGKITTFGGKTFGVCFVSNS